MKQLIKTEKIARECRSFKGKDFELRIGGAHRNFAKKYTRRAERRVSRVLVRCEA